MNFDIDLCFLNFEFIGFSDLYFRYLEQRYHDDSLNSFYVTLIKLIHHEIEDEQVQFRILEKRRDKIN